MLFLKKYHYFTININYNINIGHFNKKNRKSMKNEYTN